MSKSVASLRSEEDDWEQITTDDASVLSQTETISNDQSYVQIDHPRKTQYPGRLYQLPSEAPIGPIPSLRKSLYALKDMLKESLDQLTQLSPRIDGPNRPLIDRLFKSQSAQMEALGIMLTNYASDWETYVRNGGMSFEEFTSLDPVVIDGFKLVFGEFAEEMRGKKYSNICFKPDHTDCKHAKLENSEYDGEEVMLDDVNLKGIVEKADELSGLLKIKVSVDEEEEKETDAETLVGKDEHDEQTQSEVDKTVHERMIMGLSDW